jgi:hypothetical protein
MLRSLLPLTILGSACAGCGGGAPHGPVQEAAARSRAQPSEHVDVSGSYDSASTHVTAAGSGDFQNQPALGKLDVNFETGTASGAVQITLQGSKLYASSSSFGEQLPSDTVLIDLHKVSKPAALDFGPLATQPPSKTFELLRHAGKAVETGHEFVAGMLSTRYRTTVPGKGYGPVDVWVGDNGLVLRVSWRYTFRGSPTRATVTFSNYGEDFEVTLPGLLDALDVTKLAEQVLKAGPP